MLFHSNFGIARVHRTYSSYHIPEKPQKECSLTVPGPKLMQFIEIITKIFQGKLER